MPILPSRQDLKMMTYRDLQKICKAWGVRANLKADEMIDLLLEAQLAPKSAFTRRPTTRTGPIRLSSVVIYDVSGEGNQQQDDTVPATTINGSAPAVPSLTPVRTQKAKELQKRLGVGRPAAVGGSGPRMGTQPSTVSWERRLRSSRNLKSLQTATQQGDPKASIQRPVSPAQPPRTFSTAQEGAAQPTERNLPEKEQTLLPDIQQVLSNFIKPLQDQIVTLRTEVRRLRSLEAEVQTLGALVKQARFSQSGEETRRWEKEFGASKGPLDSVEPSTPPANSSLGLPSGSSILIPSPKITTQSGIAGVVPVLSGKRPRNSSVSRSLIVESEDQSGTAKKRPKLSGETSANRGKEAEGSEDLSTARDATLTMLPRTTSFLVYNDPEEEESPPLNIPLPEYYTSHSGSPSGSPRYGRLTTSANAPENQNTFNFSLLPEPPTPGPALFLPAFPYPEPPQSPTPMGANLEGGLSNSSDRSDVFKTFGLPPPGRARRLPSSSNITVNPSALSHPAGRQRQPSSNDARLGLNLMSSTSGESSIYQDKDASRVKKTMYGTELEGDTRFGDFGVEGVAMGFWTGGRF